MADAGRAAPPPTPESFRPQCGACFGLCCAALYFAADGGFAEDKPAGVPCRHLNAAFGCEVHVSLREKGYTGCTRYECFGAGQKLSQGACGGRSWREEPERAAEIFEAFLVMEHLQETAWYLYLCRVCDLPESLRRRTEQALAEALGMAALPADALRALDLSPFHAQTAALLRRVSRAARLRLRRSLGIRAAGGPRPGANLAGRDLRGLDMRCAGLRGACLIAADLCGADLTGADLLGADLRDADLAGADLSAGLFLNQPQLNAARGDAGTRLPPGLCRPGSWERGAER